MNFKLTLVVSLLVCVTSAWLSAQERKKTSAVKLTFPPTLPGGIEMATDTAEEFLRPATTLADGVSVAKTAPTIDFVYFPGQDYEGKPWSNWGDSSFANGKYYTAIGDHLAPQGNAGVFEYDPVGTQLRRLSQTRQTIALPTGHYLPGKIHSRVDLGSDGWLYYSTHRGSTKVTTDEFHYRGDWILRTNPTSGTSEVVAQGPVPKHCIPNGVLDPERLIFYGGTAPGTDKEEGIQFFAYDVRDRKLLYAGPNGPARYMILAQSTGRVYFTPRQSDSPLLRFDPTQPTAPVEIPGEIGIRAATRETPAGVVYTVSSGQQGESLLYAFHTQTEQIEVLGPAAVGQNQYIAALTADPTGRYLYYVPGAHGGSDRDGSAVVQYDTQHRTRKVVAFLHPFYEQKYGCVPKGTYGLAIDDRGATLCITWNVSRGSRAWDCCALTAIHIPAAERP